MSNDFLPEDYKIPKTPSGYMKFEDGDNTIRIMSSAVTGWEYFNKDNKPVRSKEAFEDVPSNIKEDGQIKHFWAFVVWNYNLKRIQILEITQKQIMTPLKAFSKNPKWGHPTNYDITITKTGEGLKTEYAVQAEPPIGEPSPEIKAFFRAKPINLEALFTNEDPFTKTEVAVDTPEPMHETEPGDIEIGPEDVPA